MYNQILGVYAGILPQRTPFNVPLDLGGVYSLPGVGRIFFVRGNGTVVTAYDDQYTMVLPDTRREVFPSIVSPQLANKLVAGRGDVICVLPGHTENISTADHWASIVKAGVRIVGIGEGTAIPTFTFTVATATLVFDALNFSVSGCRFLCAGPAGTTALTIAAPFALSSTVQMIRNQFEVGIDNNQICGTFMTVTGDRVLLAYNEIESQAAAAAITDLIVLTGADRFTMIGNRAKAAVTTAATGLVRSTATASTDILIQGNILHNWLAASTGVLNFSEAIACTGVLKDNLLIIEDATSLAAFAANAANDLRLDRNYVQNEKNKTAIQIGTVVD